MQFYIVYKRTTLENVSQRLKVKGWKKNNSKNQKGSKVNNLVSKYNSGKKPLMRTRYMLQCYIFAVKIKELYISKHHIIYQQLS